VKVATLSMRFNSHNTSATFSARTDATINSFLFAAWCDGSRLDNLRMIAGRHAPVGR
jgi:hypothetical protein